MVKYLIISITLFTNMGLYAQLKTAPLPATPPTMEEGLLDELNQRCVNRNKLSSQDRRKLFPFNKAIKVQLVSFESPDSIKSTYLLPRKGKAVDYARLSEVITINDLGIDSLTAIFYNYEFKGVFYSFSELQCLYNPKNAILFLDKNDRVFAFIEICFQCGQYRLSDEKIQLGDECTQKIHIVKSFFSANGVRVGMWNRLVTHHCK